MRFFITLFGPVQVARREGHARMLSVPAAVAPPPTFPAPAVAVNMRYCLHGMHDNTLLRLADKGRKVKARVSDSRHLPAGAAFLFLEIYVSATPIEAKDSFEIACTVSA